MHGPRDKEGFCDKIATKKHWPCPGTLFSGPVAWPKWESGTGAGAKKRAAASCWAAEQSCMRFRAHAVLRTCGPDSLANLPREVKHAKTAKSPLARPRRPQLDGRRKPDCRCWTARSSRSSRSWPPWSVLAPSPFLVPALVPHGPGETGDPCPDSPTALQVCPESVDSRPLLEESRNFCPCLQWGSHLG